MKRTLLALLLALILPTAALAAGSAITIGVTPFPHKDIMVVVKGLLEKEGYDLQIKEFTDYVTPNTALAEGSLDANFFQHVPYLENTNKERGFDLVWVAKVHIEPLGLYSKKIGRLDELKDGAQIAIPNDPTNCARALRLLEANGLVTVREGELVTAKDVVDNPKRIRFHELDAAQLPRTLQDVDASVINTNFAVEAGLTPSKDAIVIEGKESPYANVVVIRSADGEKPWVKALAAAANSPEVKAFIESELVPKGIVPAF
ncbi:MAG TPA: methionine ABC transporter substrate-binding protein [Synergistaceae bacterium]|nr:methionine ABC transporter substrate-binding protein [Synergistaceae bacterium]